MDETLCRFARRPRLGFRGAQPATDQGPPPRLFSRQPSPSSFHAPRGPPLPVRPGAIGTREGIHAAAAATRIWSTSIPCRPHSPLRCPINHRAGRLPMAAQGAKTPRLGARTARLSDRGCLPSRADGRFLDRQTNPGHGHAGRSRTALRPSIPCVRRRRPGPTSCPSPCSWHYQTPAPVDHASCMAGPRPIRADSNARTHGQVAR